MNTRMIAAWKGGFAYDEAESLAAYEWMGRRWAAFAASVVIFAAVAASASLTAQATGPVGTWSCRISGGVPSSSLLLTMASYTFDAESGRADVNGKTVHFVDGPLPLMGISYASYSPKDAPSVTPDEDASRLVLHFGMGQSSLCLSASGSPAL